MLIRRKPATPTKAPPLFIRRVKPQGYTDADGFKKPNAPENWPFGCLTQDQQLAAALQAVQKRFK